MRQGKAEAIQDYINREEMRSLSLQNSTKIALDEKMRGYWRIRTSALSEQEIAGIRIVTEESIGLSAVPRAIQPTIVSRRREEVRDGRREQEDPARDKTGRTVGSLSQRHSGKSRQTEYATDGKAEYEAMIGLRKARKKLQHATTSNKFFMKGDDGNERVTSNRSKSIEELKKATTCNRCDALRHWEGDEGLNRDTAGDHQAIDPVEAEGSENTSAQERGHRKAKARAKVGRVKFKEAFAIEEVHRGEDAVDANALLMSSRSLMCATPAARRRAPVALCTSSLSFYVL